VKRLHDLCRKKLHAMTDANTRVEHVVRGDKKYVTRRCKACQKIRTVQWWEEDRRRKNGKEKKKAEAERAEA
jgi:hypothetical protein